MNFTEEINGLSIPQALIVSIQNGSWSTPQDLTVWYALFPRAEVVQPKLYSLDQIKSENRGWRVELEPSYLGKANHEAKPGDIDPTRSLLIGDLGPDRLIALDYRESMNRPSVAFLTGDNDSHWVKIVPDIEALIGGLKLRPPNR